MGSAIYRLCLLGMLALTCAACANSREFLLGGMLLDVQRTDPKLTKLRVYPSSDFIAVYGKQLADDLSVSGRAGTVDTEYRGQRIETPVGRKRPGVIVNVGAVNDAAVLWVSFDGSCAQVACAFGFVQSKDGRFRLYKVPALDGYGEASVYRVRVSPRKRMERTTLFSKTQSTSVYFTTRGATLPVTLEVKKRRKVQIDTIVAPQHGVKPGQTPGGPPAESKPEPGPSPR